MRDAKTGVLISDSAQSSTCCGPMPAKAFRRPRSVDVCAEVDLDNGGDPITDWAFARQADATAFLNDNWKVVGIVLGGVVAVAVAYVTFRKDDTDDELEVAPESESVS